MIRSFSEIFLLALYLRPWFTSPFSGGTVTIYAYFDAEPLPVNPTNAAAVAAQQTTQFSVAEGQHGLPRRRSSLFDQFAGNGANGSNVAGPRSSLRQKLVHVLSDRSGAQSPPVSPRDGQQQDGGASLPSSVPQPPATTTTLGKLVVVVADNGPGISAENQKRLFKEVHILLDISTTHSFCSFALLLKCQLNFLVLIFPF